MSGVRYVVGCASLCVGDPGAHVCGEGTCVCVCEYEAMCMGLGSYVPVRVLCVRAREVWQQVLCARGLGVTVSLS